MVKNWIVLLAGGCVMGQVHAQQGPWTAPAPPYVPYWVVPAPNQAVPPRFLPPQQVPFPMPFWFWYAPAPGTLPFPQMKPATGETKPVAPPEAAPAPVQAEKVVPAAAPASEVSAPQAALPPGPADKAPEPAVMERTAMPTPEPVPDRRTASPQVQAAEPPARKAAKSVSAPASAPLKAPVAKAKTSDMVAAGAAKKPVAQTNTVTSKPKPAKKSRKLCWKDGRLDVCE